MIDRFAAFARRLRRLGPLMGGAALLAGVAVVGLILSADSEAANRLLIPAIVALLWLLSGYMFITSFQSVPDRGDRSRGILRRLKHAVQRGWYWLLALSFVAATAAAALLSYKMTYVWLRQYGS